MFNFSNNNSQIDLSASLQPDYYTGGQEGRKMAIALLMNTKDVAYEPGGQVQTTKTMTYNNKGQIKNCLYESPTSTYNSEITYHSLNNNIISVPMGIDVYAGTTTCNLIRQRQALNPDPNTGDITTYTVFDGTNTIETHFKYDSFGNVIQVKYPPNESTQSSYILDYTYDLQTSKYVTKVEDNEGLTSTAQYNPRFDVITSATDQTGNTISYSYDPRGRLISVLGPNEQGTSYNFTVQYTYEVGNFGLPNTNQNVKIYKAETKNLDTAHPNNYIRTDTFADFTGKVIQVKKDIELYNGEQRSVSGRIIYDKYGRVSKQYHPKSEALNLPNLNLSLSNYFTLTEYDNSDRVTKLTDEEGHTREYSYEIENSLFKTTETFQNQTSETFMNAEGKTTAVKNYLNGQAITTTFTYHPAGELAEVIDPEGISTSYEYDRIGRRISQQHPDRGYTSYEYDQAGNLMRIKTDNLSNDPNINVPYINYNYDLANRLTDIILPDLPGGGVNPNNVHYEYAGAGNGNNTGRIAVKIDGTGQSMYQYGKLGELIEEYRIVEGYNIPTMTFRTQFAYDSWNRIKQIIYPDNEMLNYQYDLGGNLKSVYNGSYQYIKHISYNHYEQRNQITYGNGTSSSFNYSPTKRMLKSHILEDNSNNQLLYNHYKYDPMGNITLVTNNTAVSSNEMGGNYYFDYQYDSLNRLTGATGFFRFEPEIQQDPKGDPIYNAPIGPLWSPYQVSNSKFKLNLNYTSSGGIEFKEQSHEQDLNPVNDNSYNNTYKYHSGTHKLEYVEDGNSGNIESFEYDYNGNATHYHTPNGSKQMFWDEQDRMKAIYDDPASTFHYYVYDDKGERTIKYNMYSGAQLYQNGALVDPGAMNLNDFKVYPNPYVVVTSDGMYTKHYFEGSTRFASRILDNSTVFQRQGASPKQSPAKEKADPEADFKRYLEKAGLTGKVESEFAKAPPFLGLYYLHTDHLGTASYVTNENGETTQFFLNLPFGETMAEQNLDYAYQNPYKFNAKELDRETGLYYYGARYYNPRLSIWYGVDPLAEDYPSWSPYVYTLDNPVRYIDPDGRSVWPPEKGYDGQTWKDSDGSFVNRNGTWYKDAGAFMGFLWGNESRFESVNTKNTNGSPGYDGASMLPSSTYDYTYEHLPGKHADDMNYWQNGDVGSMFSRVLDTTNRDVWAEKNGTTTIEAVMIAVPGGRAGRAGRGGHKLKSNPEAVGHHTSFEYGTNGKVYKYETYQKTTSGHFNPRRRYDGGQPDGTPGAVHTNTKTGEDISTPHVQGKKIPGGVRKPREWEKPR